MNLVPWAPLSPWLAMASLAFFAWLAYAFVALWRIPSFERIDDGPAPRAMQAVIVVLIFAAALWLLPSYLKRDSVFVAYALALLFGGGLAWFLRGGTSLVVPSALAVISLGTAAFLLQLSAHGTLPPGVADDEMKKVTDCVEVLHGDAGLFAMGSLFHPNLPCVTMLPLLAWWGPSQWTIHAYPMLAAALSVVAFYLLGRMLFPAAVAYMGAALLATAPMLLLFGHSLQGAQITVLEILFVAFTIDAARRLSRRSALLAGGALGLLLYDYLAVRSLLAVGLGVMVLAQLHDHRNSAVRLANAALIFSVAGVLLIPLILHPRGDEFLFTPMQYGMVSGKPEVLSWLPTVTRSVLASYHEGVAHHGALSHTQIGILPGSLGPLLLLGLGTAALHWRRFEAPLLVGWFVAGILPAVLSGAPNVHRAIVALPAIYFLITYPLNGLIAVLPAWLRSAFMVFAVLAAAVPSLRFYYGQAWSRVEDYAGYGGWSAPFVREAIRQSSLQSTMVTGYWDHLRLFASDAVRSGRLQLIDYARWLPENDSPEAVSIILDPAYSPLIWGLQGLMPAAEVRSFIGPSGDARGASIWATPAVLPRVGVATGGRACGTVMLHRPQRVVHVFDGEAEIDGLRIDQRLAAEQPWLAAGLHRACVADRVHMATERPDRSVAGLIVHARQLYTIPVHGWVHRAHCVEAPQRARVFTIEPFLFHLIAGEPLHCQEGVWHEWSTLVQAAPHPLQLDLLPVVGDLEVFYANTQLAVERKGENRAQVRIPPRREPQPLRIRVLQRQQNLLVALYTPRGEVLTIPNTDYFQPAPADMTAGGLRW